MISLNIISRQIVHCFLQLLVCIHVVTRGRVSAAYRGFATGASIHYLSLYTMPVKLCTVLAFPSKASSPYIAGLWSVPPLYSSATSCSTASHIKPVVVPFLGEAERSCFCHCFPQFSLTYQAKYTKH